MTSQKLITILAFVGLTLMISSCSDNKVTSDASEGGLGGTHGTTALSTGQALSSDFLPDMLDSGEGISQAKVRIELTRFIRKRWGIPFCTPWVFHRVPMGFASEVISHMDFPSEEVGETISKFLKARGEKIVPIFGQFNDKGGRRVSLLKLVYLDGIGDVPKELGCQDGVTFDLSHTDFFNYDPEDPNNPPPKPRACLFRIGSYGPCCHCDAGWTNTEGCDQSDNCPDGNCCQSGDSEYSFIDQCDVPYTPPGWDWFRDGDILDLPVGGRL